MAVRTAGADDTDTALSLSPSQENTPVYFFVQSSSDKARTHGGTSGPLYPPRDLSVRGSRFFWYLLLFQGCELLHEG